MEADANQQGKQTAKHSGSYMKTCMSIATLLNRFLHLSDHDSEPIISFTSLTCSQSTPKGTLKGTPKGVPEGMDKGAGKGQGQGQAPLQPSMPHAFNHACVPYNDAKAPHRLAACQQRSPTCGTPLGGEVGKNCVYIRVVYLLGSEVGKNCGGSSHLITQ